ncbi:hypothetical protein PQX77_020198 [Marasmius sp. AFHP31]|nr:hypothetical protein PQX77_020198 [Marasmius sp. AFHP31]
MTLSVHTVEENDTETEEDKIPCNTAGVPVFPDVDENEISFTKFKDLYGKWLRSLWADLLAHPHLFYDNEKYRFPAPLGSPDLLQRNTMFDFLVYLKSISNLVNDNPFVFRSKEVVTLGLTATQARVEDERHAGDELAVKPSDNNRESTTTTDGSKAATNVDSNDPPEPIVVDDVTSQGLGLRHAGSVHSRAGSPSPPSPMPSPPPPSPLPNPPSETSLPHTQPAHRRDIVSNCPPSLKQKRGKNNVVESVTEEAVDEAADNVAPEPKKRKGKKKVVEKAVYEAAGNIAAEPKKRKGKKKATESEVEEAVDEEAAENVTPQRQKKKTTKQHWDIRLAPAKGTLERSPEKVRGRTCQQAQKNAQA